LTFDKDMKAEPPPATQKELVLFFFSSGLFVLPLMTITFVFDQQLELLVNKSDWLFFASVIAGALIVVAGMYLVAYRFPRRAAGMIGAVCWAVTIGAAWM
jgi:hypothetical protein